MRAKAVHARCEKPPHLGNLSVSFGNALTHISVENSWIRVVMSRNFSSNSCLTQTRNTVLLCWLKFASGLSLGSRAQIGRRGLTSSLPEERREATKGRSPSRRRARQLRAARAPWCKSVPKARRTDRRPASLGWLQGVQKFAAV